MTVSNRSEGLRAARLLMVLSSISPLFALWAMRGTTLISDKRFVPGCAALIVLPNLFLWLRIRTARRLQEKRELIVGVAEDHRDHLLVYLFAMLLPFYPVDLGKWREFGATIAALAFIVFLFWHLNLHYMNVFFAVAGYRVFTVYAPADENPASGRIGQVLITRRIALSPGERLVVYRLSDSVSLEAI